LTVEIKDATMDSTRETIMKLEKKYSGILAALKIVSKKVQGPEESDEKITKRVGVLKAEFEYTDGDLSHFVDGLVANDIYYTSVTWAEERTGAYLLNINEIEIPVKIMKIERKNKDSEAKFAITFETEVLDNLSVVGNYIKDKENLATFILEKSE
jgi:hypothetical protein